MGAGTRQEVKRYIRQGRVEIDGVTAKKPEEKIDEDTQKVTFDGEEIGYARYEYYMLNKPAGVLSATRDSREKTVVGLIESRMRKDLFPVGRLDKDTEGLLLITNDGQLAHRLLSPKKHVDKQYYAKVSGVVTENDVELFAKGVNIGTSDKEEWTMPASLIILSAGEVYKAGETPEAGEAFGAGEVPTAEEVSENGGMSEVLLTIREGKYHQVKRMFHAVGKEVLYLKRESMGSLVLDEALLPGQYRPLTKEEVGKLWERY